MAGVNFVKSSRGGELAVCDDYLHRIDKRIHGSAKTYWKCIIQGCKARLILNNKMLEEKTGYHTHLPEPQAIEAKKFYAKLKKRAKDDLTTAIPTIYREEIAEAATSDEAAVSLPSYSTMSKSMYRSRATQRPPLPKNIEDFTLEGIYTKSKSDQNFLLADDGVGPDRMLLFSTVENLEKLTMCNRIFLDGTFKIVPHMFKQLYSVHGEYMGKIFPFVYCLLQTKSQLGYCRMLEIIRTKALQNNLSFQPQQALIDFEMSALNGLVETFPNISVKGCFFHYTQCIWRKVQEFGLVREYRAVEDVRKWIRRAAVLPLVPQHQVTEAFLWLREMAPDLPQANAFHTYLYETWVAEDALFSRAIWNQFENDAERTNNNVEGWHSKMNKLAHGKHVNVFEFIELIKQEQAENEALMRMLRCGSVQPPKQKTKYKKLNEKIQIQKNRLINAEISLHTYIDMVGYYVNLLD